MSYELTENLDIAVIPDNFYINYSKNKLPHFYNVFQDDLLVETDIRVQKIFVSREADMPVFFQTTDNFDVSFDIFSCIFYLLSRYEEYLPHDKDEHGRYKSSNSILSKKDFNFSPIVEIWLAYFKKELLKVNSSFSFKKYQLEYTPTFDIDNGYKYFGRNWKKNPPNIFSIECIKVLLGRQQDPYDIFDWIQNEIKKFHLKPVFFFLLNDTDKKDSNVSPLSKKLHELIRSYNTTTVGIHPSYWSIENNSINEEMQLLKKIANQKITVSRQHFLKIHFPDYYRKLQELGIQKDFSLSYPDIIGFRAGFSREFYFFDIEKNEPSGLILQPSCWMDATYEYYQQEKINIIQENFLTVFNQLKEINGKLVPIFHNDLLAKDVFRGFFSFINRQVNLGE